MKPTNQPVHLIIQTPASLPGKAAFDATMSLKAAGIKTEKVKDLDMPPQKTKGKALAPGKSELVKTNVKDTEINPWDVAHLAVGPFGTGRVYAEPDGYSEFQVDKKIAAPLKKLSGKSFGENDHDHDPDWPPFKNTVWHIDDAHSQLKKARAAVAALNPSIRIGHLDTGYSKDHPITAFLVNQQLQRNFIEGESQSDAHDRMTDVIGKMPGHGTGTYGILAGKNVNLTDANPPFNDLLGGAPFAEVIPCRVAESVILIKNSAFAHALNYLTNLVLNGTPVHVVSMSMGGAPSKSWADAVNSAYEAGITVVTAAGNNFGGLPTRNLIFPARFQRVIAACGATFEDSPYYHKKIREMQGCYGPLRYMDKALAAYTPNTTWCDADKELDVNFSGGGTSSATPQIASAAAIYYRMHHAALSQLQPWQRVEAIRHALYTTAKKSVNKPPSSKNYREYFGNGIIRAFDALSVPVNGSLPATPPDSVPFFPILGTLFPKSKATVSPGMRQQMFNTELSQLVFEYPELSKIIGNDKVAYNKVSAAKWKKFKQAVIAHPAASKTLKKALQHK